METNAHGMLLEFNLDIEPTNNAAVITLEILPFDKNRDISPQADPQWLRPIGIGLAQLRELHARLGAAIVLLEAQPPKSN